MLVLALDTSSAAVTAAVVEVTAGAIRALAERVQVNARGHGEFLAPGIAACLDQVEVTPHDLGAIAAGLGPGPYTGLRVGLVTAAVLGEALGIPTYGVCSLDAIAGSYAPDSGGGDAPDDPDPAGTGPAPADRPLLVATDARRKEVYWARYVRGVRVEGPAVSRPADLPAGSGAMTGAGARLYAGILAVPLLDRDYPSATALVRCAAGRIRDGAPSETLTPLYLRRPDAVPSAASKLVTQ
jgi:tRNA threonylcarbamoyl adenosine modification protein YeaZ